MKRVTLIGLFSIVVLSACQRNESADTTDTYAATATEAASTAAETSTSPTPAATTPYDLQFIDTMTKHHQMAIDLAKAAEPKFDHQSLRDAAKKMVDDQTNEIAQLRGWRDQWYSGAASGENMQMPGMSSTSMDLSHMQTMSGHDLDMMFTDMMIPHHQGAVAMAQDALARAEHQEIKDFAQKVIDMQKKEIDQMQQWKKAWAK